MDIVPEHGQEKDFQPSSSLNLLSKSNKPHDINKKTPIVPEPGNQSMQSQSQHLSNDFSPLSQPETATEESHRSPTNQSSSKTTRLNVTPWWISAGIPSLVSTQEDVLTGASSISIPAELQAAFRAQTKDWFWHTQAPKILQQGELPDWFHGFTTRREAEERLKRKPLGCFLVRFCESSVGFVLSYRGTERCRHFVLDQLDDKRYVILGEQSGHTLLQDLLQHYHTVPIPPFNELLTTACSKTVASMVPAAVDESKDQDDFRVPNSVSLTPDGQDPNCTLQKTDHSADYTQVNKTASANLSPPTDKYALLMKFHIYTEPTDAMPQERHIYHQPREPPIDYYAMGRGSITSALSENIYSEVDIRHQETVDQPASEEARTSLTSPVPVPAPRHILNRDPTLPLDLPVALLPKESLFGQNLFAGSLTKQTIGLQPSQILPHQAVQFDDLLYAMETVTPAHTRTTASISEIPENIYEKIAECCMLRKLPFPKRH